MELTQEHEALLDAFEDRVRAREREQSDAWKQAEKLSRRGRTIKELIALGASVVTVIVIGTVTVLELRAKPTDTEVDAAVEAAVAPVRSAEAKAEKRISDNETKVGQMATDIDRIKRVQDYQLENSAWQSEVLDHVAQKKKGKPSPKPEALKRKERQLIR